jgi:hypothetical protein
MNSRRPMIAVSILLATAVQQLSGSAAAQVPSAPPRALVVKPIPVPVSAVVPGNITASLYPSGVVLNWTPVPNATGYSVSRTPTSGYDDYSFPTSVTQPTFQESLCLPGATLTYTLSAVFADGHAGPPATVTYTLPPPPSLVTLTATPEIGGPVTLRWQPPPVLPYSYWLQGPGLQPNVFFPGGPFTAAPQSVTQYLVNAAQNLPGGTYTYSVSAQYAFWCDVRGNPAQATVALRGAAPHTAWLTRLDPHPGQFDASKNMDVDAVLGAQYLAAIGGAPIAKNTLDQWKQANGFYQRRIVTGAPLRAVYFNSGDLNLGREMHCNQTGQIVACYVSNYQLSPFSADEANVQATLAGAISGVHDAAHGYLATVAMEVSLAAPGNVKFYVYDNTDTASARAILDTETSAANHFTGGYSPFNCLTCHGGNYNPATGTVTSAAFLPFDVYSFRYSTQPGFRQADQEESFRLLNALVRSTRPLLPGGVPDGIVTFIDGMYSGQVGTPGAKANNTWIPPGWTANPNMYTGIVKPFCRTCHLPMSGDLGFPSYDRFRGMQAILQAQLCSGGMPQAEVPFRKFWQNPNVSYIAYLQDPSVLNIRCN